MAAISVCLIIAPLGANCCVRLACNEFNPSKPSEPPCHDGMASHHNAEAKCHSAKAMCDDTVLLAAVVTPEEFFRNRESLQENQLGLFVAPRTGIYSGGALLVGSISGSAENQAQSEICSVTISPLKI